MNNTLEAWLKDNMPEAWFAGYDVADSALIALNEYRLTMDRLRAQVAERDATITGDGNLENQYLFQIAELRGRVAKHKATIAERDATIAELRAQVAKRDKLIAQVTKILGGYPDSDLLSLATTVAAGYERWCNGHDAQVDSLRAEIATLKERLSRCTCTDDYGDVAE